ncbi:MAG: peptide ABC transporter substrate-binding protein [Thermomicrobiales bacterium]
MTSEETWDQKQVLRDPEALAVFERSMRGAGVPRRTFLAMASAVAGSAALAACGGSSATSTPVATVAPTKAAASAAATTAPTTAPSAAATVAPTTGAASAAASATKPVASAASTTAPASTTASSSAVAALPTVVTVSGPDSTKVFLDYLTTEPVDNDINRDLYAGGLSSHMAGLLRYDQDFNLVPELAESYTNSGPVFTYKLRKGIVWSDGQPITAKDFVYSYRRMMDPRTGNGYGSFWDSVIKGAAELSSAKADATNLDQLAAAVGVRAVDDSTFEITGDKFGGLIPNLSGYVATVISRQDEVKKYADAKGVSSWTDPGKTGKPVLASGPFQITSWKHNQSLDVIRNDKYWNAANIKQKYVTYKIIPDLVKSTLPFENGDVDYQVIPSTEVDRFKSDAKLKSQVFAASYPGTRFLVPDTGHPPFDKLEVRKAVLLSIDKDRLVNQVGRKIHTVAYAMTAPGVFGYFDDADNKLKNLQKFDKTAALAALKGTTFEGGKNWPKITLSYNVSDTDIPTGYPDEIARQLKDSLNMDVGLEPLDSKVWNSRRFALDLQFLLYRWYQDYPDPHNQYYQVWSIHNKGSARQSYTDPTFDDLATKGAAEPDKQKRLDLYYQAETRIQTQFAYMPIHWRTDQLAIKPYATKFPKNKQGFTLYDTNIFSRLLDYVFVTPDSPNDPPK